MDNNDIKLANVMYGSGSSSTAMSSGTTVYLNIEFTKEGGKKLEEISGKYMKTNETSTNSTTTENSEENEIGNTTSEDTEETEEKTVSMQIDGTELTSTSFDEVIKTGNIQLSIGQASTDSETLNDSINQARNIAMILDSGNMPIKYNIDENKYILSDITQNDLNLLMYIVIGIFALASIVLIFKFRLKGVLGAICNIGLISILLLTIKYTNVVLSIEGIVGILLIVILNYVFTVMFLSKVKEQRIVEKEIIKNSVNRIYKDFCMKLIPICIIAVTFCFIQWIPISSFGMVMFWGIVEMLIYNYVVTINVLKS